MPLSRYSINCGPLDENKRKGKRRGLQTRDLVDDKYIVFADIDIVGNIKSNYE
jgi:hypothetical protein